MKIGPSGRDSALRRPPKAFGSARRPYLFGLLMLLWTASVAVAQSQPEVRRARPIDEQPAPHALPAMAFTDKDYATALPLFHRSAAKSKEPAVALSARYFEARCLEATGRKEEAADIYVQAADAGNPNPYREDARATAASIFASKGKKIDALKQYEALANESSRPALKAESAVRGGMIALELVQSDKGKIDKAMAD